MKTKSRVLAAAVASVAASCSPIPRADVGGAAYLNDESADQDTVQGDRQQAGIVGKSETFIQGEPGGTEGTDSTKPYPRNRPDEYSSSLGHSPTDYRPQGPPLRPDTSSEEAGQNEPKPEDLSPTRGK